MEWNYCILYVRVLLGFTDHGQEDQRPADHGVLGRACLFRWIASCVHRFDTTWIWKHGVGISDLGVSTWPHQPRKAVLG